MMIVGMIASSASIVGFWLIPFTWPVAIPATVFYVVIMTFMIIIKVNMSRILLISSGQIPQNQANQIVFIKIQLFKQLRGCENI